MRIRSSLVAVATAAGALVPALTVAAPAGAAVAGDGTTAATAAASCWAVKQSFPASATGVYWLQTPKLIAPQQFYCDQTTDGGGWVLIGRGREGWGFGADGQGAASAVRNTPSGTVAFVPAALATDTVNGLINGGRVDQLTDGVRIRRAANATGTTWQEVRWDHKNTGPFSWAFGGGQLLDSIKFDDATTTFSNPTWTAGSTRNVQLNNSTLRLYTNPESAHNNRAGFAYGTSVTGSNNSTSYLWQYTNEGRAIPFAQVYLRPRLTASDLSYPPIPDTGIPASTLTPLVKDAPESMPWGVAGVLKIDDPVPSLDASVLGFAQIGTTMFVGGKFQYVQQNGGAQTEQRFLAAFDVNTGAWRSTWRPTLDGAVWDLVATPDGKLIVGGNFTNVNGAPNTSGLAALDPATGAVRTDWTAAVLSPYSSSIRPHVRALALSGSHIYVAGGFKQIMGGVPATNPITVARLARVRVSDGRPDGAWKPTLNGGVVDLSVSPQGDRAYVAGSFTQINTTTVNQVGAVATADATTIPIPWFDNSPGTEPQNTINEYAGQLYLGGSQHYLHRYNRDTFQLLRSHMTKSGGDYQTMEVQGNVLYGACHCTNWDYEDSQTWSDPTNYTRIDPMNYIGAYDLTTLSRIDSFQPVLKSANGEGPWEMTTDSNGCLWSGGDHNRGRFGANGVQEWVGGFAKFCPRDIVAPSTPTNLNAATANGSVTLTWGASTDAGGLSGYEVLRNDRVIATVYGATSFTDTPTGPARYFVRALDTAGNRSATTPVVNVLASPPDVATLVPAGSTWSYRTDGVDLGTAWRNPGYNTAGWASGPAQLGWGDGDEATVISSTAITQYFVRTFTVTDPGSMKSLLVRLLRDDAAAVYLNGVEIARSNLPAGAIGAGTPAAGFVSGAAESTWYEIPAASAALVAGTNTIAVELHQAATSNGDASFDLALIGRGAIEGTAPTAPTNLAVTGRTDTTVSLAWTAGTDATGVIGHRIRRNGTEVAFTTGTVFTDSGLPNGTNLIYDVITVDTSGNSSAAATVATSTYPNTQLIPLNATWKWRFQTGDPGATWKTAAFNDSGWASGAAELGMGDGGEATIIWPGATPTPPTAYFRHTFTLTDPGIVSALTMDVIRDDGVAVYINGVEVARNNLVAGATNTTLATTAIFGTGETTPVTFSVPPGVLTAGTNTIAVEVHQAALSSIDLSFALRLVAAFAG